MIAKLTLLFYTHISSFFSYITFHTFLSFNSVHSISTLYQKIDINCLKFITYWLSICTISPRWTWTSIISLITLSIDMFNYIMYSLGCCVYLGPVVSFHPWTTICAIQTRISLQSLRNVLSLASITKSGTYRRSWFSSSSRRTSHSVHSRWTNSTLIKSSVITTANQCGHSHICTRWSWTSISTILTRVSHHSFWSSITKGSLFSFFTLSAIHSRRSHNTSGTINTHRPWWSFVSL